MANDLRSTATNTGYLIVGVGVVGAQQARQGAESATERLAAFAERAKETAVTVGNDTRARVEPGLDAARQRVAPTLEAARQRVAPTIDSARQLVEPTLDSARQLVEPTLDSLKEQGAGAWKFVTERTAPVRERITNRS